MCGIALIWDKKKRLNEASIQTMVNGLTHRGPDRQDSICIPFIDGQVWLGHSHLQIMDESEASHQPISFKSKHLCYNGEIYNFEALGQKFFKQSFPSDTSLLSHLIGVNKTEKFKQFIGMYAMAWVNEETATIHLSRDQSGIKPLFYYEDDNYLIVASEISAIFSAGLVKKEINPQAVAHYFKFKFAPKPTTFFKNVFEVKAGTIRTYSTNVTESDFGQKYVSESFDELLLDAVNQHMVSKKPVGLLLSGGVDSSLLLACLQELGLNDIHTFTIAHHKKDQKFGTLDGQYAKLATALFGGENQEIRIDQSILSYIPEHVAHFDQPIADSGSLLNWYLMKHVGKTHEVVLSGAGADELFGGYNRLWALHKVYPKMKGKAKLANSFSNLGLTKLLGPKRERLIQKLLDGYHEDPRVSFTNFAALYPEAFDLDSIAGFHEGPKHHLDWARWWDQEYYLQSDVLAMTDRMAMASSVEVRTPFLDQRMLSFSNGQNTEGLLNPEPKGLLKTALSDFGGEDLLNRSKEGFGLPLAGWFRKGGINLQQFETDHIIYDYLDPTFVKRKINEHKHQKRDHSAFLWSLIIFEEWHRITF